MQMTPEEYRRRVEGCWIGKNIGGTLGMPMEWNRSKNDVSYYTHDISGEPLPNDDLDIQVLLSSKIGPVLANNFPPQLLKNLFSVSEAPALIIKVQYLALMRQPVQQSCCEDSVAKKLRPAIKAFI